jgi:predicted AlkP superfamily pyrophosphatase or phosphodiesterase
MPGPLTPPSALGALQSGLALAFLALMSVACAPPDEAQPDPLGLVVVISVDQLMPEQLERYDEVWTGGFRRVLDQGYVFHDAVHDHAITYTSPGHASMTTGVVPARHGIVGNSWREWRDGEWSSVSSVADPDSRLVGGSGSGSSPVNLLVGGLPDWILQAHPESRVVSLSGKSTSSVLMAGRSQGHVYWFSVSNEGFVTSDFYRSELAGWVERFNREVVPTVVTPEHCWEDEVPEAHRHLSRRDTADYEADGVHIHFPHCVEQERYRGPAHFISRTPWLDQATLDLAREAVRTLELGSDEVPDYLALGLSATDRVGHDWGPWSREQMNNLFRLDRELGAFLQFLDEELGSDGYVLALTSDHGVLPLPEYLQEQGEYGLRLTSELTEELTRAAEEVGGGAPAPDWYETGSEADEDSREAAEARARLADLITRVEWVEEGLPLELLAADSPADTLVELYRKSFHPQRLSTNQARFGVEVQLREGTLVRAQGTTHGEPYLHDRRVPLIFMGAGIPAGGTDERAATVDVPPTLAAILGIEAPTGLDGRGLAPPRR